VESEEGSRQAEQHGETRTSPRGGKIISEKEFLKNLQEERETLFAFILTRKKKREKNRPITEGELGVAKGGGGEYLLASDGEREGRLFVTYGRDEGGSKIPPSSKKKIL